MSGKDRTMMIEALRRIKTGKWGAAEDLIAQTKDPLAARLYFWLSYTEQDKTPPFARISSFITQNPDWPRQVTLEITAEKALAKDLGKDSHSVSNQEILDWFSAHPPRTSDGMDIYLGALKKAGQIDKLTRTARKWWQDVMLTPERQSAFYENYKHYLDMKSHIARWNNQIYSQHYTNARVIARLLPKGYKQLTEARIALAEDKGDVNALIASVPEDLRDDPGLVYERIRWRRRHDMDYSAIKLLHEAPAADEIPNPADWWTERHILARRLIEKKQYESAYLLVEAHKQKSGLPFAQAEFLAGWLALEYLHKPWRAFEHFEALYYRTNGAISKARGAYWAGRASSGLGHEEIAEKWYKVAAKYQTTFYGQMALETLKKAQTITDVTPPEATPAQIAFFERKDMVQIARLLHKAGMRNETGAFLSALANKTDDPADYILVADLVHTLGHNDNGVAIAKKGLRKGIFLMDHAYPTLLADMRQVDTEWALVHAIIRQESAFDQQAISPAGARGLMQLMPSTAKEVADKNNWPHSTSWLTSRPTYNIRLGANYLQQMLDRYNGSYVLAIAAYNAGPGRVDSWLEEFGDPRKNEINYIDWMESIPVYETRNYVQRVLEGAYIYRIKLKNVQKSAPGRLHIANNHEQPTATSSN